MKKKKQKAASTSSSAAEVGSSIHQMGAGKISEYMDAHLGSPWYPGTTTGRTSRPNLPYPGLSPLRRVVLDLNFNGYGLSAEIVQKGGELLAIAEPAAKYLIVPGTDEVRMPLGLAVEKLVAAGAKFDLIVCDVPRGQTTPAVGMFAPPRPPQATTGRRLVIPGAPIAKPTIGAIDLGLAVWRATQALLSPSGEALLEFSGQSLPELERTPEPGLEQVWWTHPDRGGRARLYLHRGYRHGGFTYHRGVAPRADERFGRIPTTGSWTPEQRQTFLKALRSR